MINKFDICKHFKGETLLEKNIYGIMEVKTTYTGEDENFPDVVLYKPLFHNDKCFIKEFLYLSGKIKYEEGLDLESFNQVTCYIREYCDLVEEISPEYQKEFHQKRRIETLSDDEMDLILTKDFIDNKLNRKIISK